MTRFVDANVSAAGHASPRARNESGTDRRKLADQPCDRRSVALVDDEDLICSRPACGERFEAAAQRNLPTDGGHDDGHRDGRRDGDDRRDRGDHRDDERDHGERRERDGQGAHAARDTDAPPETRHGRDGDGPDHTDDRREARA